LVPEQYTMCYCAGRGSGAAEQKNDTRNHILSTGVQCYKTLLFLSTW
jgi:hypothetical protein